MVFFDNGGLFFTIRVHTFERFGTCRICREKRNIFYLRCDHVMINGWIQHGTRADKRSIPIGYLDEWPMKTGIRSVVIASNRWSNKPYLRRQQHHKRVNGPCQQDWETPQKRRVCGGRLPFCKNAITAERIRLRCHSSLWCLLFHKSSRSCQNADATSGRVEGERNIRGTLQERLSRFLHDRSIWRPQIFAKWTRSRSSLPSSDEWMSTGILSGFHQLKTDCKQRG